VQTRENHELGNVGFVEAPGFRIGDVGEPFHLWRYIGETSILFGGECACLMDTDQLVRHHSPRIVVPNPIMYFIGLEVNPRTTSESESEHALGLARNPYYHRPWNRDGHTGLHVS
jgi:hypothetical protein